MLPAWQDPDLLQGANSQILRFPGCVDIFLEVVVLSGSFALLPATARAPAPCGQWAPLGLLGLEQLSRLIASYSAVVRSIRL